MTDIAYQLVAEFFNCDRASLHENTVASDVSGWDSLRHTELLLFLEEKLNIEFDLHETMNMPNLGALSDIVNRKTGS